MLNIDKKTDNFDLNEIENKKKLFIKLTSEEGANIYGGNVGLSINPNIIGENNTVRALKNLPYEINNGTNDIVSFVYDGVERLLHPKKTFRISSPTAPEVKYDQLIGPRTGEVTHQLKQGISRFERKGDVLVIDFVGFLDAFC